ncbi:MAG: lysylphosphatidylglycerol synthase transmembrane domain-containing protein, partial [Cytophagales bacterium]
MKLKNSVLYSFVVLLTAYLLYRTFQNHSISDIISQLKQCHHRYVCLAVLAHLINHGLRAYRWKHLLKAQHSPPSFPQAYYAEMAGFFTNSIFLRLGDITRCHALQKMTGTPV